MLLFQPPGQTSDVAFGQKTNTITCNRGFVARNENTDQNKAPIQTT